MVFDLDRTPPEVPEGFEAHWITEPGGLGGWLILPTDEAARDRLALRVVATLEAHSAAEARKRAA